jgi:hypothetical protein
MTAFLFCECRIWEVGSASLTVKIEFPAWGVTSPRTLAVPRFVPNGSTGTLKITELHRLPLAMNGPRPE